MKAVMDRRGGSRLSDKLCGVPHRKRTTLGIRDSHVSFVSICMDMPLPLVVL